MVPNVDVRMLRRVCVQDTRTAEAKLADDIKALVLDRLAAADVRGGHAYPCAPQPLPLQRNAVFTCCDPLFALLPCAPHKYALSFAPPLEVCVWGGMNVV